jgi:hypothetical protein
MGRYRGLVMVHFVNASPSVASYCLERRYRWVRGAWSAAACGLMMQKLWAKSGLTEKHLLPVDV